MTADIKEYKMKHDFPGMIKEVLAQKGGTATLPCKLIDPGAGIVCTFLCSPNLLYLVVGNMSIKNSMNKYLPNLLT